MLSISLKLIATTLAVIALEKRHNRLVRPQTILNSYDYIIVGAGGSGAVVAKRLAEDITKTVLLLEAGGPQSATTDVPAFQQLVQTIRDYNWNYPMVRQKYAFLGVTDGQRPVPSGKAFGGSTIFNTLNYYRDSPEYWQTWDHMFGIKNWTFSHVLPYFLKSENNLDKSLIEENPTLHRSGGPLTVTTVDTPDPMLKRYVETAIKYGADWTHPDGRQPMGTDGNSGITIMQRTIRNGIRQSTATAFLENNIRPNLQTICFSFVTKVLFDSNKRAIGVKFRRFDVWHTVYARREVIVSSGAVGSPKLLLLSGIGPKEHLKSLGIPVISDISVGSSMSYWLGLNQNYDIINQTEIPKPDQTLDNLYDMYVQGKGPLTYMAVENQCFREQAFRPFPTVSNGCTESRTMFLRQELKELVSGLKMRKEWEDYYRPYLGHAIYVIHVLLYRVTSNGTLRLNTTDPFADPLIDPCIYCNPQDLEDLSKTFQTSVQFFENNSIKQYIRRFRDPIPGCTPCPEDWYCYEYIKCMAQTNAGTYLYLCGTARMGADTDTTAVVDNRFRVKGVSGLRVIDISVVPLCSPQLQTWAIMLGERGADFIKEDNENTKPLIIITDIRDEFNRSYNL